jgi:hypothetical protein
MRPLLIIAALSLIALPLTAQQDIRWSSGGIRYRARTVATDSAGQLVIAPAWAPSPMTINPDTIPGLLRRVGGARTTGQNVLLGALIGGGIGAILGFVSGDDNHDVWVSWLNFTAGQKAVMFGGSGFVLGAIGGAVFSTPAVWIPYGRTTTALRISPVGGVNSSGEPRLGVRITF